MSLIDTLLNGVHLCYFKWSVFSFLLLREMFFEKCCLEVPKMFLNVLEFYSFNFLNPLQIQATRIEV